MLDTPDWDKSRIMSFETMVKFDKFGIALKWYPRDRYFIWGVSITGVYGKLASLQKALYPIHWHSDGQCWRSHSFSSSPLGQWVYPSHTSFGCIQNSTPLHLKKNTNVILAINFILTPVTILPVVTYLTKWYTVWIGTLERICAFYPSTIKQMCCISTMS